MPIPVTMFGDQEYFADGLTWSLATLKREWGADLDRLASMAARWAAARALSNKSASAKQFPGIKDKGDFLPGLKTLPRQPEWASVGDLADIALYVSSPGSIATTGRTASSPVPGRRARRCCGSA